MYFATDSTVRLAPTHYARIFIGGDLATIKQACREFCMQGLCVTVDPTTFIYTGGEEAGAVVGLINYPRFPAAPTEINQKAAELGKLLMERCCQKSFTIQTPDQSFYYTRAEV